MLDTPLFTPTPPDIPEQDLPRADFLRAVRSNALRMWPRAAYERMTLQQGLRTRPFVLLNAPEDIRHVLVDNTGNYRRSPASIRILRPIVGNGLLLSEGDDWRHQRRTIAPALAPRVIPMLCRHITLACEEAVARLDARGDASVDMLGEMQFLALDIAGRSMFSLEMARFGPEMRAALRRFATRHAQPHLLDLVLPPSIPSPRDLGRWLFRRRWMHLIGRVMHDRMQAPRRGADEARDLFDLLLAARDPETNAAFTQPQLRDQIATMIVAGHETTALTLFWSMYLLANASREQDLLAEEVRGRALGPDDAADALGHLPHTRAVVNEALRLYPPAFTLARQALGPDQLSEIAVPRGMVLMIAPWVLGRHQRLWENPDAFDPARFMPGRPAPDRYAYMPFGAGPRICVGAQFALAEATLVLARLIQRFRVVLDDTQPVIPCAVVTTQPSRAAPFRLVRR